MLPNLHKLAKPDTSQRVKNTAISTVCELIKGDELLFELISQRYERGSALITSNMPFEEWIVTFGIEHLSGALLDRLTHHVNILEIRGESYRLNLCRARVAATNS